MQSPYPLWQQLLIIFFLPPLGALVFGIFARGWANVVQGGKVTEKTTLRQRKEVLAMVLAGWIVGFGLIIFVHIFRR
jgi:hypothetical protein